MTIKELKNKYDKDIFYYSLFLRLVKKYEDGHVIFSHDIYRMQYLNKPSEFWIHDIEKDDVKPICDY